VVQFVVILLILQIKKIVFRQYAALASSLCTACDCFFTAQDVYRNDMFLTPRSNPANLLNPTIVFYFQEISYFT